jgi:hypothetical protein
MREPGPGGPDPGETVVERFGGWQLALAAAVLLAVVVIVDALFLPALMGWREPPLVFPDLCTAAPRDRAGGFALALLAAALALLAALRLAAPRSAWAGLAAFVVFALPLQFYVASQGGLTAILESGLLGRVYGLEIPCPNDPNLTVLPSELLQQFYNPGLPGTRGGEVPFQFTDMLAANILLAFATAALLFVVGLFRAVAAFARRRKDGAAEILPAPLAGAFKGPERTVLVQSALIVLVCLMAAPGLLLYATSPTDASRPTWDLLWAGSFILLLDLARLMLVGPKWVGDPGAEAAASPTARAPDLVLERLADQLAKDFKDEYLVRIKLPPVSAATAAPAPDTGTDIPTPGERRHLLGTLTADGYDQIMRTLSRGVLDHGRTALIVCPHDTLHTFTAGILERLARTEGQGMTQAWTANTQLYTEGGGPDIIFASPETLSGVLDKARPLRGELSTLGGIFVVGLDRMDMGLLNLGLWRLKPLVKAPKSMIAMVQSEERGNAANYVGYLPMLAELANSPRMMLDPDRRIPGQILVLSESPEADFDRAAKWPTWVRALLQMRTREERADVFLFDTHADHARTLWRDRIVGRLQGERDAQFVAWAADLSTPTVFPLVADRPAAVLRDRGNLADAIRIGVAEKDALEHLRLIVTGAYPGASFLQVMLEMRLKQTGKGRVNKADLEQFADTYGSHLPTPRVGPVELALLIQQAYHSTMSQGAPEDDTDTALRQDSLDKIWSEHKDPLRKLGISNTRVGLERLFRRTHRVANTASFVIRDESDDRRWSYRLTDTSLSGSDILATYALEQNQNADLPGAADPGFYRLAAADHGLSYARGVHLNAGGEIYEVRSVDAGTRTIRVETDHGRDLPDNTFVRDYAITLRTDGSDEQFVTDARTAIQGTEQPFEIATGYAHVARRTSLVLEHRTQATPMAPDGSLPRRIETDITSPARLRSLAVLRLYGRPAAQGAQAQSARNGARSGRAIGATRQGGGPGGREQPVGPLAFTLATTLQDVLRMLFRPLAHRIAVISPDAVVLPPPGRDGWDNTSAFCLERQPSIMPLARDGGPAAIDRDVTRRHHHSQETRAAYAAFFDSFIAQARSRDGHRAPATEVPLVTLALIEDCDHDLGIARFLNEDYEDVLAIWRDYLAHYARRAERPGQFDYAFGAPERPRCYDFGAAAEIVQRMAPRSG